MIPKSIRWRLQLWYGLILLLVLAGFGVAAYQLQSGRQWRRLDGELQRRVNVVVSGLRGPEARERMGGDRINLDRPARFPGDQDDYREPGRPIRPERPPADGAPRGPIRGGPSLRLGPQQLLLFDQDDTNGFYFVVWDREGVELARSTNAPARLVMPEVPPRVRGPRPNRTREKWREAFIMTPPGEIILVGRSIVQDRKELRRAALLLAGIGGVILVFGMAGGAWLTARAIRPIHDISNTAARISEGDLSQRISVRETESELGQLAGVLNSTFSRLESAFAQQKQFTSDAAHELRTPVSVILTQTQSALNRERSAPEYRQSLEACQRSAQRMRGLIESLLELARLEAGQEQMRRSPTDLSRIAADCVEQLRPLAAERGIQIETDLPPAPCSGDDGRLAQVVTNLLSNAVHHNVEGGIIRITSGSEAGFATVRVEDEGPGIAPEHLPHIFDRFYRADAARTTSKGRTGLGLAISKAIVDAHQGTIEVKSELGRGTKFTVRIPV